MNYIADGMSAVTPYLIIEGANDAIKFYETVFGAVERMRMDGPGGSLMHGEIEIGGAPIMLADANPDWGSQSPKQLGGTPVSTFIYVPDVDATMKLAEDNGATVVEADQDMFWGDRMGRIVDPFGHAWGIATHVEDVPEEEMAQRQEAAMKEMMGG